MIEREYTALFGFCGIGPGALGTMRARVKLLDVEARFRSLGGIDNDPIACRDFERLTGSPSWCIDIKMLTGAMLRERYGAIGPDFVFGSPPCQGASRLLSTAKSKTQKYTDLNELTEIWIDALMDAWGDTSPPKLVLIENVPGLPTRAAGMLRRVRARLRKHGYVFHASTHDCGEIGGLAQHRQRYLLVARHAPTCAPLLYQPPKKRVRGVGEVLGELPMPATVAASAWGKLHEMPKLSWRNWLRLALIPAGGDWRDLDGVLEGRARREVFRRHAVQAWEQPIDAVTGPGGHSVEAVADPRGLSVGRAYDRGYGVLRFTDPSPTVAGGSSVGQGAYAVADERFKEALHGEATERGVEGEAVLGARSEDGRVLDMDRVERSRRVRDDRSSNERRAQGSQGAPVRVGDVGGPDSGGDARVARVRQPGLRSTGAGASASRHAHGEHGGDVGAESRRPGMEEAEHKALGRDGSSDRGIDGAGSRVGAQAGRVAADDLRHSEGAHENEGNPRSRELVEDVRILTIDEAMALDLDPRKPPPFTPLIIAEDGTWHRPMTLLELAALQGIPSMVDGAPLRLEGTRTQIATHIGNAVPVGAGEAIGMRVLSTLAGNDASSWSMESGSVWVLPEERTVQA